MMTTTKRLPLVVVAVLVLLACSARESAGLPWEDALRVVHKSDRQLPAAAVLGERDVPQCPNHPRAVPQAFISKSVRAFSQQQLPGSFVGV
jgi:hypothetical protein